MKLRGESVPVELGSVFGVMPPRISRRRRQNQDGMQGNEQFARTTQQIGRQERAESSDPKKAYGIKRLKKLRATVFKGSIDLADVEDWLNMLEKCFDVMNCPKDRKTFRGIFEDKYYPSTYCEAKRDEFLVLKQGSLSVAEYERKYTELSWYADVIMASESDRTSTASGFRGREQWRFTPGINISSRQDFKNRYGGQASRNVSYGSVFQRQSQRIPSHPRSKIRSQPGQESIASTVRRTPCTSCGKNHRGQCLVGAGRAPVVQGKRELLEEGKSLCYDLTRRGGCTRRYYWKEVVFRKQGFAEVVFRGTRKVIFRSLILVLKAEKLLRKGCTAFLTHVVVVQREKLQPEDVPLVKEFLDVFSNDLLGLPLDREIEFTIELLPGTSPISQAPYRMAPRELKELKMQL
ncbi:Gag protease polyprotein [Cucumis melo var. makuwa]|uniref:Gag protease polyprotein n=1 Tax=Cucumis melo var. makuwa TaxID=1194695 RepID=A0A5D3CA38_CUCMM|nr:Gag protease polyprotein [Cucumis melo var. makuwa]TYK08048.1 Gag protease polyprotein [Cucumis melo var. makuwa]